MIDIVSMKLMISKLIKVHIKILPTKWPVMFSNSFFSIKCFSQMSVFNFVRAHFLL